MTRKLALVLALCLGLVHQAAFALGLGEIDVESALNQPFSATIELRNSEALERNEIIATLASVEDFERVGVERFFFLSDLTFETVLGGAEGSVLRVTSRQPITEPFVNFVVEMLWPSGRLLKEFTVLLDPPTYAARPVAAPRLPEASTSELPGLRLPDEAPSPSVTTASGTASRTANGTASGTGALLGDTYGVTDRNDTLWTIALQVRPDSSFSVHQTMLALLRLNPEAFIGNNINQLKAGYVLRVPDATEIRRLALADAVVQVNEQNNRWRSGLDRAPLDARETVAEKRGDGRSSGELRLVSATSAGSANRAAQTSVAELGEAPATGSSEGNALRSELASAQAQLDGARRQSGTLRNELEASAAEREALERQLQVKDEQIAQLQRALAEQLDQRRDAPAPGAPSSTAAASGLFGFSWLVIAALIGALVLLGAVALVVLRRISAAGDDAEDPILIEEASGRSIDETQMMPALTAADLASTGAGGDEEEGEDVLAEADVSMAYGNFTEAAASLGAALEADPNRADIRLKLLEVYVEQGDVEGFDAQAQALADIADDATVDAADRLAARLPGASSSSGEVTAADAVAAAPRDDGEGGVSLDFDLAVDDETSESEPPADLDSLDIDLDLGDFDADASAGENAGGLDFDLDLDVDSEDGDGADEEIDIEGLEIAGDEPVAAEAEEDFALALEGEDDGDGAELDSIDFDLDLSEASSDEAGDDEGLEFDIDELDDHSDKADGSLGGADESADRTLILARDELEISVDDETAQGAGDDAFDFDIDELAGPEDDPASGASELSLEDTASTPDLGAEASDGAEDEFSLDDPFSLDDGDALLSEDTGEPSLEIDEALSLDSDDEAANDASALVLDDGAEPLPGATGSDATELDFELDDAFDFDDASVADEITTKLELARAYIDMNDEDGAKEILEEVVRDGDEGQQKEAGDLLSQVG
ncbi:MAG: FimV/HubP family polar landmark protein [Pseudomonadota bacterium]|nr:FimV/HubP family polar landmark protein [Pseudomonadota bacterium]